MFFSHAASFFAWLCLEVRQDPDWKMNSLLVGQPGHLRGHAVGGTLKFGPGSVEGEWLKWRSGRVHDESLQDDP